MNLGGFVAALVLMGAERGILDVSGAKSCGTDSVAQLSRRKETRDRVGMVAPTVQRMRCGTLHECAILYTGWRTSSRKSRRASVLEAGSGYTVSTMRHYEPCRQCPLRPIRGEGCRRTLPRHKQQKLLPSPMAKPASVSAAKHRRLLQQT
jgi:hypothetical protein